jgi:hypothetical protein
MGCWLMRVASLLLAAILGEGLAALAPLMSYD